MTWGENEAVQTSWRGYQFTDALGSVTQTSTGAEIEYDDTQNLEKMTDARLKETTYEIHPKLNRVESVMYPISFWDEKPSPLPRFLQ